MADGETSVIFCFGFTNILFPPTNNAVGDCCL
jgi:hypothetical protein